MQATRWCSTWPGKPAQRLRVSMTATARTSGKRLMKSSGSASRGNGTNSDHDGKGRTQGNPPGAYQNVLGAPTH